MEPFTYLDLYEMGVDDDCFVAMCEFLPNIKGLELLHVPRNKLTVRSLEEFAKVVNQCETLEEVDFPSNQIASLAPLCAPLRTNRVLTSLLFADNEAIGDENAMDLLRALIPHSSVETVSLWRTDVTLETRIFVRKTLDRLHSHKTRALLALASARGRSRLGLNSAMQRLPQDHLRLVAKMLE